MVSEVKNILRYYTADKTCTRISSNLHFLVSKTRVVRRLKLFNFYTAERIWTSVCIPDYDSHV